MYKTQSDNKRSAYKKQQSTYKKDKANALQKQTRIHRYMAFKIMRHVSLKSNAKNL